MRVLRFGWETLRNLPFLGQSITTATEIRPGRPVETAGARAAGLLDLTGRTAGRPSPLPVTYRLLIDVAGNAGFPPLV